MKLTFTFLLLFCTATVVKAQSERSVYRKNYIHMGITAFGKGLDNGLSPAENVFSGHYGAQTGYVLDMGHIFYFLPKKTTHKINYGLDWTYFSFGLNKFNQWPAYAGAAGQPGATITGAKVVEYFAMKLGPVLSFNPVEKVVIDVHFQVAPTFSVFDLNYAEHEGQPDQRSFSFVNGNNTDNDNFGNTIKNRFSYGLNENLGLTVRRKAFGLTFDYLWGKSNSGYEAYDGEGGHTSGKEKLPVKSMQFKLSFTL